MSDETIMTKGAMPHYVAALHFDMTTPEGREEHQLALQAWAWKSVVDDILHTTRTWAKHGHEFSSPEQVLEAVRETITQNIIDRGLGV